MEPKPQNNTTRATPDKSDGKLANLPLRGFGTFFSGLLVLCLFLTIRASFWTLPVPNNSAIATPQRLVTLGNAALEAALVLGIKPVGAAPWVGAGNPGSFPSFLDAEQVEGIEYLGDVNQPSLERILDLKPDLILGSRTEHRTIYALLSQIAPTVLCDVQAASWQESFRTYARALKHETAAEKVISRYDRRLARLHQNLGDRAAALQVSVVRFMPAQVRLYLRGSHIGRILADAQLSRPPAQDRPVWKETISLETIPRADGDVIFVALSDPQTRLYRQFQRNPLWQRLQAVRARQVYEVDFEYWIGGEGAIAANLVVDDLLRYLAKVRSTANLLTQNPPTPRERREDDL